MTYATKQNITDPATTALDIEIAPGLRVRDLSSRAECAQAVALLQKDVNRVVGQLHNAEKERIATGKPIDKVLPLRHSLNAGTAHSSTFVI